jgi:hypothetical protein
LVRRFVAHRFHLLCDGVLESGKKKLENFFQKIVLSRFIQQINSASVLSLPLPLMVLLWGTLTFPRPSKTFWVVLIAYTQAVVLIKCACQFEAWFWNESAIAPNQPFAPARILGIERKKGYATYDLILLLVMFCHRIILKSLGLWKSEIPVPSMEKYKVQAEVAKTSTEVALTEEKAPDENGKTVRVVDDRDAVVVEEDDEETKDYVALAKISFQKYVSVTREFVRQLFDRESRHTADIYGFLFLCDFVNFFVILFGFSAFGTQEGDGGVLSYFEENKVPITFLLMLIIQFFFIVVDRALYLRKNMFGKIIFQIILIVGLHIWMFFILPSTTERSFNATRPPVMYYMIKCFYLLFSAYQIRCGEFSSLKLELSRSLLNFLIFRISNENSRKFLNKGLRHAELYRFQSLYQYSILDRTSNLDGLGLDRHVDDVDGLVEDGRYFPEYLSTKSVFLQSFDSEQVFNFFHNFFLVFSSNGKRFTCTTWSKEGPSCEIRHGRWHGSLYHSRHLVPAYSFCILEHRRRSKHSFRCFSFVATWAIRTSLCDERARK